MDNNMEALIEQLLQLIKDDTIYDIYLSEEQLDDLLSEYGLDSKNAAELGFDALLNEADGETIYFIEGFNIWDLSKRLSQGIKKLGSNVASSAKMGLAMLDQTEASRKIAEKLRKFVSKNISHSYLTNKAVKELNKFDYDKRKKELDEIIDSRIKSGKNIPELAMKISNDIDIDKLRRERGYPYLSGRTLTRDQIEPTTPLKDLMRNTSPKIKNNLDRRLYGLTSGLVNSDTYSRKTARNDSNAYTIDEKGNKKKLGGYSIGHATAEVSDGRDTPLGNKFFVRNIDKPYKDVDKVYGKRDSIGRLFKDIGTMTKTYPHELRHVEDRILQGVSSFHDDTGTTGYIDDPREIRAREAEQLIGGKKMKYSAIPALVKGVGENIYKKLTGKGTGSKGDTMDDTYDKTLKREDPKEYKRYIGK